MSDPPRYPRTEEEPGGDLDREPPRGTRRWPFVLGIVIVGALLATMIILHLTGTLGPGAH